MCGIVGLFNQSPDRSADNDSATISAMAGRISHRGPDHQGLWQDDHLPLTLGHQRLSILDLSHHGHQPMLSHSGRYILSYNGEIYNHKDIQEELERAGIHLTGRSDTEILLAAIDKWGLAHALQKINGMFAFSLWDRQEKNLTLVRDRMGKKPLYVGWLTPYHLVFTSEVKALHSHDSFSGEIDRDALAQFMRFGYVPAPLCIFKGIIQLLPGTLIRFDFKKPLPLSDLQKMIEPYWHHGQVVEMARQKAPVTEDQAYADIKSLLQDAVKKRLISDVPVGSFLSGGLDSSLVTALMCEISETQVNTYSIGFAEDSYDESHHAREIASHLGTTHHEKILSHKDALDIIPHIPGVYDEPFADSSQIPTTLICQYARQDITVALTGDGGDEVFGGYQRAISGPGLWSKIALMPRPLRHLLAGVINSLPKSVIRFINPGYPEWQDRLSKVVSALSAKDFDDFTMTFLTQWKDPFDLVINADDTSIPLTQDSYYPLGLSRREMMMFKDSLHYLPNDVLTKVDRASMAVSLEVRSPLLDVRLFEYMWSLPENMKIHGGQGKIMLRRLLEEHFPRALFERSKQGFSVPVRQWLRGPLKQWAGDYLHQEDPYLHQSIIVDSWNRFQAGDDAHFGKLWTVLMWRAWHQQWQA